MVEATHEKRLTQILEMIDTACEAVLLLMQQYDRGDGARCAALLADLRAAAQAIGSAQAPLVLQLKHAYSEEMLENIADTLQDIGHAMEANRRDQAFMLMEFQLFPFLRLLRESLYFWGCIFPDRNRMKQYYREEFAAHYRNLYLQEGASAAYRLSIVVTAYNHLETTKQCMEQLLRMTDFEKLNAELILIDHGSSDGTREWFEGLGVGKVIRFKRNVRMYMFALMAQVCQGDFFCFVSNDVLVTKNWAEILLECFASDPYIIAAVPATPNIANLQIEQAPTNQPEEFIAWANRQNRSDPSRWDDRARLMPPLGMYRTKAVSDLGFADPYFYSMEFWDDDFSLRARRAGYRQVLCNDVACYHFGSVTGRDAQQKEGTLQYGRQLFLDKNGVDAWGSGFCYDPVAIQLFIQCLPAGGDVELLALDCGFGDTPLQLRSRLRRQRRACRLYQLTAQKKYLPDLAPLSDQAELVPWLAEGIAQAFAGRLFSAAYIGRDIGCYEDIPALLEQLAARLRPGGILVFACAHPFYAVNLHMLLQFSLPDGAAQCSFADPEKVYVEAKKHFACVHTATVEKPVGGLKEFAERVFGKTEAFAQLAKRAAIQTYYFICRMPEE